ncbi:putative LOC729966 homolog isoform 1-T1 [Pholidichthys leucotaenia]
MPAAMRLAVLASLLTVTACAGSTTSSGVPQEKSSPNTDAPTTSSAIASTAQSISTLHLQTTQLITNQTTQPITSGVTSASPQTKETKPSTPLPQTTTTVQSSNGTVSEGLTTTSASESLNTNDTNNANTTTPVQPWRAHTERSLPIPTAGGCCSFSTDLPSDAKGALASNPGLVAVICIFCIIFVLAVVVAIVKCVQSPRSNFERLEDVPMGKVNEESPFAQYSK